MQYSPNLNMNRPERADQYNLDHWNENTDILDTFIHNMANCIIASNTTINGNDISVGNNIKILFTSAISGSNKTDAMMITFNGDSIPVKVSKNGVLSNFIATELTSGVYTYLQAYTTLELVYDGTQFIIIGNPTVINVDEVNIYSNGKVDGGNVGDVKPRATRNIPYGWLECNGQSVLRSDYPDLFNYFNTQYNTDDESDSDRKTLLEVYGYADSTHFNIPDYREVVLSGMGQNTKDTIATHDIFSLGKFKDDQGQRIRGKWAFGSISGESYGMGPNSWDGAFTNAFGGYYSKYAVTKVQAGTGGVGLEIDSARNTRAGTTTRGKTKGVVYIIKVL